MFRFEPCTYKELQMILASGKLTLNGWSLLVGEYIDGTEKILDKDNNIIAMIYYQIDANNNVLITDFEVFPEFRLQGNGKKIIAKFLSNFHCCKAYVYPNSEGAEKFWRECGFDEDYYIYLE